LAWATVTLLIRVASPFGIPEPRVEVYSFRDHREVQRRMADNDMESPEGGNEARDLTMAAGFGAAIGIIVGTVVFAITQNPVWIGIGIPFGAAFGFVFGRYLRRLDDDSPLVAIFGPFLINGYPRDKG
jgi:NhaP-type Na+/H+ or K+/H+ antiporter